jgi:predicted RNase H-like HicB family nuclease
VRPEIKIKKAEREIVINGGLQRMIKQMTTLTAIVQKEEDMYVAKCPEVGTVSQGKTIEEAVANLKEATELYLEEFPLKEEKKPFVTVFEVTDHAKTSEIIRA